MISVILCAYKLSSGSHFHLADHNYQLTTETGLSRAKPDPELLLKTLFIDIGSEAYPLSHSQPIISVLYVSMYACVCGWKQDLRVEAKTCAVLEFKLSEMGV